MPWVTAAWIHALGGPSLPCSPPPAAETTRREQLIDTYLEETARYAATHEAIALQEARRGHRRPPVGHGLIEVRDCAGETAVRLAAYQRRLVRLQAEGRYTGGRELLPVQEEGERTCREH